MKKYWKIILLVVVLGGGIGVWYGIGEYNRKPKGAGEMDADIQIQATELTKAFAENEATANQQYNNKVIAVTGTVRAVEKDDKGIYTITLAGDGDMSNVICTMEATAKGVETVKEAANVKIQGFCNGAQTMLGTDVLLNRASLKKEK